jgi:excisionase family DNA binding protein
VNPRRWLGRDEAAKYLGISPRTLQRWTSERDLPSVRIGEVVRYDIRDLDEFMEQAKREAIPAR